MPPPSTGQTTVSVTTNTEYFLNNLKGYRESVSKIDTYRRIHDFVSKRIAGVDHLLDIGNGGVFDYDASRVGRITAVDLFLDDLPPELLQVYFPPNAQVRRGSALALPEPDATFDTVLMVMLLHHLAGSNWRASWENARLALAEAWHVVRPGGRLLIIESCVPEWFFRLEKPAFWLLTRTVGSVLSHPITLQFPAEMIVQELRNRSAEIDFELIPKGRHVLQFGFKVPSFVTPIQIYGIEARKS